MSQFTGQVVTDCQSESVYCLLNTLHKLKHLRSYYSVGNLVCLKSPKQSVQRCILSPTLSNTNSSPGSRFTWTCCCLERCSHLQNRFEVDFLGCQMDFLKRMAKICCSHGLTRFDTGLNRALHLRSSSAEEGVKFTGPVINLSRFAIR